ncbi:lymphocyte antigen 96-like [Discoglossus pictus]
MDLHLLTFSLDLWYESKKFGEATYDYCNAVDEEFTFCTALKGETVRVTVEKVAEMFPLFKGIFSLNIRALVGESGRLAFGSNVTIIVKE